MKRPQTEEEKLRAQIPLANTELAYWLTKRNILFEYDSAGIPWLSNSTLRWVLQNLALRP